jgi:hypothetical protein
VNVIIKPSNTVEGAKFSSYDSSIASISPTGRISANKLGLTYLFAGIDFKDNNDKRKFDTCAVIVVAPEEVSSLEGYLDDNKNTNLKLISDVDLTKALDEFFNVKYSASTSTTLVNSLNSYLDEKFNFAELKAAKEAELSKVQTNSSEVISGKTVN